MCTVSFVPKDVNRFVLTSNRDEEPHRNTKPPMMYHVGGKDVVFPKDEVAGGTWIGVSNHKRVVCLMNGGFVPHQRRKEYRLSRGIIVTDLLTTVDLINEIGTYNFMDIEPFTIILVDWEKEMKLMELIWDGNHAHLINKPLTPTIWSSSLLYHSQVKQKREEWFNDFLQTTSDVSETSLLHFHKTAGEGSSENDLVMDRGFVKTKSISQVVLNETTSFHYEDLQNNRITRISF